MKTSPIRPAEIEFGDGVPFAPAFGDVYHARAGALAQAEHVFLRGNGLPQRWAGRERFVVLETGFGLGNNFLATWHAWRHDPQRCERLVFLSVEKHPPEARTLARAHEASPLRALAGPLAAAWPPLTHNLHSLAFEGGRVRLMLAFGDVADWLPELVAEVDAFYLDGFAPAKNPQMWERRVFKALARLAAPQATAATWSVARPVRDGLAEAGFVVQRAPGFAAKGEMTVARHAPAFTPRRAPSRLAAAAGGTREAVIVGAGMAGASMAAALQAEGFACTVIDRQPGPAMETSGNPGGLFHGVVTPEDGAHARFNRAAALRAHQQFAPLLDRGMLPGRAQGLLRLQPDEGDAGAMRALLARLGLPAQYAQAVAPAEASALAGVPLRSPAWFYPGGGWISPAHWVRHALQGARLVSGAAVQAVRETPAGWQVLDAGGRVIAAAPVLVLANAEGVLPLAGGPVWPLQRVRGQVTTFRSQVRLHCPLAGSGYAIDLQDGQLLCGATHQPDDPTPGLREEDHRVNLSRVSQMLGPVEPQGPLSGRVGWRLVSSDRMPVLGPLPAQDLTAARLDQPRFVPRRKGLYTLTALGSRGLAWAPLAAQTLAAWIAGAPLPVESSLLDAVDVARFASRQARQRTGSVQPPPSER
ncbi:MAG: FAD-dependent 5-carboxymethylaminomethyl-2-thiouridine(34) oxidoreductase MnmC [Pseudomonadota bacterium]